LREVFKCHESVQSGPSTIHMVGYCLERDMLLFSCDTMMSVRRREE